MLSLILIELNCSTYLQNRKKDSLDIITFELHDKSYGINTRISFLQLGIFYQNNTNNNFGIKNGIIGNLDHNNFSLLFLGSEHFKGKKIIENPEWEKELKKIQENPNYDLQKIPEELKQYYLKKETIKKENLENQKRNKFYDVYLPFGTIKPLKESQQVFKKKENFSSLTFYTDIQIKIALYYGVTIGFNIGEFIDFLAGIFNVDLFKDDE